MSEAKIADAARAAAKEEIKARSIKMQAALTALVGEQVRMAMDPVRAELADMQARLQRLENPAAVPVGDEGVGA